MCIKHFTVKCLNKIYIIIYLQSISFIIMLNLTYLLHVAILTPRTNLTPLILSPSATSVLRVIFIQMPGFNLCPESTIYGINLTITTIISYTLLSTPFTISLPCQYNLRSLSNRDYIHSKYLDIVKHGCILHLSLTNIAMSVQLDGHHLLIYPPTLC